VRPIATRVVSSVLVLGSVLSYGYYAVYDFKQSEAQQVALLRLLDTMEQPLPADQVDLTYTCFRKLMDVWDISYADATAMMNYLLQGDGVGETTRAEVESQLAKLRPDQAKSEVADHVITWAELCAKPDVKP
jgi:hypothetical protein